MIRTEKRMRLCAAWLALDLLFIWGNSLLPGNISGALSQWVRDLLAAIIPGMAPGGQAGQGLLRKLAHFTEFALLGMCLAWLFGMLGRGVLPALGCGFLAACMDETIQRFVPDRGPSVTDVAIDTAGVLLGIALLCLGHTVYKTRKINMEERK